jgi:hypothetical protein
MSNPTGKIDESRQQTCPMKTRSVLDGGGGNSTGGVYYISGTIGQPDAGGNAAIAAQ